MGQGSGDQKKPKGRTLAEFAADLSAAERILLSGCAAGGPIQVGSTRPEQMTSDNGIRAEFFRFLALGGDQDAPVHESGIELKGAWIEGDLNFQACRISVPLFLDVCCVNGRIVLRDADVHSLFLDGSKTGEIYGDGLEARGDVYLRNGFEATDSVRLVGASIGGDLSFTGGSFTRGGEEPNAINCNRAQITGNLFFREVRGIVGSVSFEGARARKLDDDLDSWRLASEIGINGFRYEEIGFAATANPRRMTEAGSRMAWLNMQSQDDRGRFFKHQPWEQAIKVLREMGHVDDAKQLAIEKQTRMRKAGQFGRASTPFHFLFGALYGYGYQPWRLFSWVFLWWLVGVVAFGTARDNMLMVPIGLKDAPFQACLKANADDWTKCVDQAYANFLPALYSLDVILPVIGLKQKDVWTPVIRSHVPPRSASVISATSLAAPRYSTLGILVYGFLILETLFGWAAGLMLVAVVSGLVKKD
jgi:hypothetical protein